MSFKLTLDISDEGEVNMDFDGNVNHMVLIGALENIKHSIMRTVEFNSMQAQLAAAQEQVEQSEEEEGGGGE
jgi:hypothetical protein